MNAKSEPISQQNQMLNEACWQSLGLAGLVPTTSASFYKCL
jgi:hypothetical protein